MRLEGPDDLAGGWLLGGCSDGLNGHIRSPNPIFVCHSAQGGRQTQEYSGRFPKRQLVSYFFFRPQAFPERARNASRRCGGAAQGRLSGAKASRVVRAGRAMAAG